MIGTNDAAPKFNADLRLVGSHFLSLLHMLATLRRKHSRLHRAPIFVVIFIQGSSAYLVVRGWWLPTGGHLLEKSVTSWVTYSPVYVTVGGQ